MSQNTIPKIKGNSFITSDGYKHYLEYWKSAGNSNTIIIGIHGYSDYSNSFKIPANLLNKFDIDFYAFDLRGFGRDVNRGVWFDKTLHIKDVHEFYSLIQKENPKKKIFILGESMGGAIVVSLLRKEKINISGLILVAPAIWDFKKQHFFLSKCLSFFATLFPNLSLSGKRFLSVIPSDNVKMLKEFSSDPNVIRKSTLSSLNGVVDLMNDAYKDFSILFKNPKTKTLLILPIRDYIVPRTPLLKILESKLVKKNIHSNNICIGVFEQNYHMILRDIDGDRVTRELKEWIINNNVCNYLTSFSNPIYRILSSKNYHLLDKN